MFSIEANVQGASELDNALSQLPKAVGESVIKRVFTDLLTPVAVEASRLAPRGFGPGPHLADSYGVSTKLTRSQRKFAYKKGVTVYAGARDSKAHLIEFGTGPRYQRSGKFAGQVTPHPMLRPAWDMNKARIEKELRARFWNEIEKAARSLSRRAQKYMGQVKGQ